MFEIKGIKDNIIDLGGIKEYNENFEVASFNDNGKRMPFSIDLVTTDSITVNAFGVSSINIEIDVSNIIQEEYITFKNILGETLVITIKPNSYFTNDRVYKFKISKTEFNDNGEVKIRILSKVNGEEIGWKCIYDGRPISYVITPMESDKSEYVTIKSMSQMFINFVSTLTFQQNESGEIITFKINNTPEGMKKNE